MNEAARVCKHYFQGEFLFSSIAPEQVVGVDGFLGRWGLGENGRTEVGGGRG